MNDCVLSIPRHLLCLRGKRINGLLDDFLNNVATYFIAQWPFWRALLVPSTLSPA
jgi:hypothetical protein